VLVRGRANRITNDSESLVLLKFPIDFSQNVSVPEKGSVVLNGKGQYVYFSTLNIAPRVGFFGNPQDDQSLPKYLRKREDTIFGPVKFTHVYISPEIYPGSQTVTDNDGKYNMSFLLPYCPGGMDFTTDVWAELRYANFSPNGAPAMPYYLRRQDWTYCFDLPPFSGTSLGQAADYINAIGVLATRSIPVYNVDLKVDVMFLSGKIVLKNQKGGQEITVGGETTYEVNAPDNKNILQEYYDFDGDGQRDDTKLGDMINQPQPDGSTKKVFQQQTGGPLQAVYFSSNNNPNEPDAIRLADTQKNKESNGLLKTIDKEDLRKTDILVFRESTGELVLERKGLTDEEVDTRTQIGLGKDDKYFFYRLMLRGPNDSDLNIGAINRRGGYTEWATRYKLEEPFRKKQADHLKSGEWVRLVAINRPTGYVGTQRVQLNDASDNGSGLLSLPVQDIVMSPPNLKIWAERSYDLEKGILPKDKNDRKKQYLIGAEGAALAGDKLITVYSEWLDEDGRALPEGLGKDNGEQYGLTGRLAKVTGQNQLTPVSGNTDAGQRLAEFPIAPGRQTQVLRFNQQEAGSEHFYIHVNGTQKDERPNFGGQYSNPLLAGRPEKATPFLTPIYDENKDWQTFSAYLGILRETAKNGSAAQNDKVIKPLPSYVWSHRPEYQFSQYQLEINELNRINLDENGREVKEDIYNEPNPLVLGTDQYLEAFYSLLNPKLDRLTAVDGPQDLVLSFGAQEIKVKFGNDQRLRFDNLDQLAYLASEDFLTLRLYSNQDAGNILWQFGFYFIGMAVDLNRDGIVEFQTKKTEAANSEKLSDKTSEKNAFRFWMNKNYDVVNNDGDIDLNLTYCPESTLGAEQVCEQWDDYDPVKFPSRTNLTSNIGKIESEKDLEDFAPLAIKFNAPRGADGKIALPDGHTVEIKANGFGINLFKGAWDKGLEYLDDNSVAKKQTVKSAEKLYAFELKKGDSKPLEQKELDFLFDAGPTAKLIFEGTEASDEACATDSKNCYLEMVIREKGKIIMSEKLYMSIYDIKHFYDHYTLGVGELTGLQATATTQHQQYDAINIFAKDDPEAKDQENDYTVMVHGWRMQYPERVSFGETAFKRLYWSGYKGRFCLFSWPTGWFEKPAHIYNKVALLYYLAGNSQNYDNSESYARRAGGHLANFLAKKNQEGKRVKIFAHSMGNVVVSEALRASNQSLVTHYVASQAAEVAGAYNQKQEVMSDAESRWRLWNDEPQQINIDSDFDMPPDHYRFTIPTDKPHGSTLPKWEYKTVVNEKWGPQYYSTILQSAGTIVNFYNAEDNALDAWEINQFNRPSYLGFDGSEWNYRFKWDCPYNFISCQLDGNPDEADNEKVTDEYYRNFTKLTWTRAIPVTPDDADILAHIIPTRTHALGQVPSMNSAPGVSVIRGADKLKFGPSNQGHSAQFYTDYSSKRGYWNSLLEFIGIDFRGESNVPQ
jgi:Alpha/beta hydrolase of unknown function (DUF900)